MALKATGYYLLKSLNVYEVNMGFYKDTKITVNRFL